MYLWRNVRAYRFTGTKAEEHQGARVASALLPRTKFDRSLQWRDRVLCEEADEP